ncbi:MAG TPA: family 43 glycosylhydrolase, partial [Bacteroidota bacterium]|nr:family 43 glycosylhydrolase [Bacteroidota bacterium]
MKVFRFTLAFFVVLLHQYSVGQSPSFGTFMNPVIPGDHPDCTVTKIGNDFYTTGSSFNPTPVIYHSTDLVHWEAIAQPVSAAWTGYGDVPAGGCWGGQMVFHNNKYWDYFSRANTMYFVTADQPKGPWSMPVMVRTPQGVPGLGYDNSIFIDDDNSWYLLVKNGQVNNWIVQLGDDGQPAGAVFNLCWINPAPSFPFSWAEGPVMWKHNGSYYYSFARDVAGGQKVFRSSKLTADSASWTNLGDFFNLNDPSPAGSLFAVPNHASAAVMIDDGTSWVIHPVWARGEWYGQGRQGLLNQVRYDAAGKPTADYPINVPKPAPKLPSSGIPWMVPHTDLFSSAQLHPEWSFLGYTPASSYSLSARPGWLRLSPKVDTNTIIKNDGEHNYSLITRLEFDAKSVKDQAGLWVFNGLQTLSVRLYSGIDSMGVKNVGFSFDGTAYFTENTAGNIVWLKLVRVNHLMTGFWSADGALWHQVGTAIDVISMDNTQPNYNAWTGNRQGLFVKNRQADFDLFIYRDAYTPILAECPANQYGTGRSVNRGGQPVLDYIHTGDWALYAGVEFGNAQYARSCDSVQFTASCGSSGGNVEVWLDSIDTGKKIATCTISPTEGWLTY